MDTQFKRPGFAGITLLLVLCVACVENNHTDRTHHLDEAVALSTRAQTELDAVFARANWEQVVNLTTQALESGNLDESQLAQAHQLRAEARLSLGQYDLGLRDLAVALQQRPADVPLRLNYAIALDLVGRKEESVENLSTIIKADPAQVEARQLRGTVLAALGRNEEAIDDLSFALSRDPSSATLFELRGDLLRADGRYLEAVSDYESALRILENLMSRLPIHSGVDIKNPRLADIQFKIASGHEELGQIERAIDGYRRAIEFDSGQAEAIERLGALIDR